MGHMAEDWGCPHFIGKLEWQHLAIKLDQDLTGILLGKIVSSV